MKTIAYVIPYFGKFPKGFEFFLLSCKNNPTIDWLIFTDDKTNYEYPSNVKVKYYTFEEIKKKVQSNFDFEIVLDRPYKFCDYKPAYGEIFKDELKNYDYWGMCDLDLVWGNIRKFITDDILEKYERIGFLGHSTIYKNNSIVNSRYRTLFEGNNYKKAYTTQGSFAFDEIGMDEIYRILNIDYYKEIIFANLDKYNYGFSLGYKDEKENWKNRNQVFCLNDGNLYRYYLNGNNVEKEEYFYVHFWCRPITYKPKRYFRDRQYLIYADKVIEYNKLIEKKIIRKKSQNSKIKYYVKSIWYNRKKITLNKIVFNIKRNEKIQKKKI